ncbi:Blp family class II bacteriocin [Altererythrobacter sp. ZODW24]|uniref:Blp family class II bacteriocin n=1 Tax=Altererythrobacter sp. ZODW24 TaxID=2185142 RepID=UPI000DF7F8EA|nr:Blp family class II bacteriocin [Altererythrobacter sp. ZODW24]
MKDLNTNPIQELSLVETDQVAGGVDVGKVIDAAKEGAAEGGAEGGMLGAIAGAVSGAIDEVGRQLSEG